MAIAQAEASRRRSPDAPRRGASVVLLIRRRPMQAVRQSWDATDAVPWLASRRSPVESGNEQLQLLLH